MREIGDLLGINNGRNNGSYGIEIETSSFSPYDVPSIRSWASTTDGSLRNFGIEYLLKSPKNYEQIPNALTELSEALKDITFCNDSYCSVHIHMNVKSFTMVQALNLICLWYLFEDLLVNYCGPDRDGNVFCLKNKQAEFGYFSIVRALERDRLSNLFLHFNEDTFKYGALNLSSISIRGSLEVRTLGEVNDMRTLSQVQEWVNILDKIYVAAKMYNTPSDIIEHFEKSTNFLNDIFKDCTEKLTDKFNEDIDKTIKGNAFYVLSIDEALKRNIEYGQNTPVQESPQPERNEVEARPMHTLDEYWTESSFNPITNERLNQRVDERALEVRLGLRGTDHSIIITDDPSNS